MKEKPFNIYVEGYRATGEHGKAFLLYESFGESLEEAINNLPDSKREKIEYYGAYYQYWGCRLFDNLLDAQKMFG